MNHASSLLWLQFVALLAVEVALLTLIVGVWQRFVSSASWRRILWQAAALSVLVITLCELSGSGRNFAGWILTITASDKGREPHSRSAAVSAASSSTVSVREWGTGGETPPEAQSTLRVTPAFLEQVQAQLAANQSTPSSQRDVSTAVPNTLAPPSQETTRLVSDSAMFEYVCLVWLTGFLVVMGRIAVARCLVVVFRRQRTAVTDSALLERISVLAEALGIRRRVSIIESSRLTGPIAFGLFRPTIALPPNFTSRHEPAQQDAMLAHELAHVAGRDAFWYLLADVASALLWWHPVVWWLRRQLHVASESAADEASLIVADGPKVLAECLVELGARLVPSRTLGGLGVTGFRSHLGRRVHSLLNLRASRWSPPHRLHSALMKTLGATVMVAVVILCSAWVAPRALTRGDSMITMQQNWKRSLATLAAMLALNAPEPGQAAGTTPATAPAAVVPGTPVVAAVAVTPPDPLPAVVALPESKSNSPLEAKLKAIVLNDVEYNGLPLGEVLKHLSDESRKRDPDKKGINFLINPNQPVLPPPGTIDPTTGLQPVITTEPVDIYSINVKFNLPLRNITMKDLLDAIVKVAEYPIEYSFEDYGVVISLRADARMQQFPSRSTASLRPQLSVQTFRVDTNTFIAGLENAFGIRVGANSDAALRELLNQLGVTMDINKSVFYNRLTGVVMVRATRQDMEIVAAAMETLGGGHNSDMTKAPGVPYR